MTRATSFINPEDEAAAIAAIRSHLYFRYDFRDQADTACGRLERRAADWFGSRHALGGVERYRGDRPGPDGRRHPEGREGRGAGLHLRGHAQCRGAGPAASPTWSNATPT